jgi:hypothetical protein
LGRSGHKLRIGNTDKENSSKDVALFSSMKPDIGRLYKIFFDQCANLRCKLKNHFNKRIWEKNKSIS